MSSQKIVPTMTQYAPIVFICGLLVLCNATNLQAQWRQLPIPSVGGAIARNADGTLSIVSNGTLCRSDTSKSSWKYLPFPYELNGQFSGFTVVLPPRQVVPVGGDTLLIISNSGEVYMLSVENGTLHAAMTGLRPKRRSDPSTYLFTSRGKHGELLLCHDDLYQSSDNGLTWQLRYMHPTGGSYGPGAVNSLNPNTMLLFEQKSGASIYRSSDNGFSWRRVMTNPSRDYAQDMLISPDGQIHVGRFRSEDLGESWSECLMDPDAQGRIQSQDNIRFSYDATTHGIFALNVDRGLFFKEAGDLVFRRTALATIGTIVEEPQRMGIDITHDETTGTLYSIINDSLYAYCRSVATPLTSGLFSADIRAFGACDPDGDTLFLCTSWSALKSTNAGRNWSIFPNWGTGTTWRNELTFSKRKRDLIYQYATGEAGIRIVPNGATELRQIRGTTNCKLVYDPFSTDTFYGGEVWVWRTSDSAVLAADPNAPMNPEIFDQSLPIQSLQSIAFDPRRRGVMLLGGMGIDDQPFLYRTPDRGGRWDRILSIQLRQAPIEIICDPVDVGRVLVIEPEGVHLSTDDGNTWTFDDLSLGARTITCFITDPEHPQHKFLGVASPTRSATIPLSHDQGGGVWESENGGSTWKKLPIEGLFNYNISHLLALLHPSRLLAGSPCGAYEYPLDTTSTSVSHVDASPKDVTIEVYPNPNRGVFTLDCIIDAPSPVRIVVRDVLGRVVAQQLEEADSCGKHQFKLTTSSMRTGVHLVTVETRAGVSNCTIVIVP